MPADNAYVLTPNDVRNIRSYVHHKYASMPQEKRAEIVADAVTRIIHKQLPNFDIAIKRQLTQTLIRTTVLEQQRPVSADDIYALCLELDQNDEAITKPLGQWVREQEAILQGADAASMASIEMPSAAEVIQLKPLNDVLVRGRKRKRLYMYSSLFLGVAAASILFGLSMMDKQTSTTVPPVSIAQEQAPQAVTQEQAGNELPSELRYTNVDREKLVAYLESKSSLLAEPKYYDAIIQTSKQFDIHPVLLFAITGQEQGFVPKSHKNAEEIANNPFNVFHSWREFNTTIEQSSQIAARTIVRLSKDKPADTDAFAWINREYAEDPNWSNGVQSIFKSITAELDNS